MTAGEFAKKYGIDYQLVRRATFRTTTRAEISWALEYPEAELKKAVETELTYSQEWHLEKMEKIREQILRLTGKDVTI